MVHVIGERKYNHLVGVKDIHIYNKETVQDEKHKIMECPTYTRITHKIANKLFTAITVDN